MQSWSYAILFQRLQATFHWKKFRQFREYHLNNIWSRSLHIRSFTSKKNIYIKLSAARQFAQLLVRHYLKSKTFSQPCNIVKTHAILTHIFRKVLGPRLQKQLLLNGTVSCYLHETLTIYRNFKKTCGSFPWFWWESHTFYSWYDLVPTADLQNFM